MYNWNSSGKNYSHISNNSKSEGNTDEGEKYAEKTTPECFWDNIPVTCNKKREKLKDKFVFLAELGTNKPTTRPDGAV